jgi:trigger factor
MPGASAPFLYRAGSSVKVSTEKIPDAQIVMTIEVEDERLDAARTKALKKLAPKAKVPGFRPGKAPPDMVRRYFGEERILDEALDDLVPDVYREAIEADESIVPIARPQLIVEKTEPLVVKATIPVRPTVDLGDYASVRVETQPVEVEESRVDETLLALRRRAATHEPMERAIDWRDIVRLEVEGTIEVEGAAPTLVGPGGESLMASKQREPLVNKQEAEIQLSEERDVLFPGFEEQLLGKKKGDRLEFDLDVPEGIDEKYKGKQVRFTVTILETKEEVLPEVDEEFAKAVGDSYQSVDALRARIREDLERAEQERIDAGYHEQILAQMLERATLDYPPVMVDAEVDRMLHDQFGHVQHEANFGQYLRSLGRTEDQIRAEFRPIAEARLKNALILSQAAEDEKIEVTDDDVNAEVETMTSTVPPGPQGEQIREMFASEDGRGTIRRNLKTSRTLARLVEIATQGGAAAKPKKASAKRKKGAPEADTSSDTGEGAEATAEPSE